MRDVQNGPTVDLLSEVWAAFLRRCIAKQELILAMYFFHQYSERIPVERFHAMNVFPNNPDPQAVLFFLSWSAGFAAYPGSNTGSLGGEAARSPWEKQLKLHGSKWELEDALRFMQDLYRDKWDSMYGWSGQPTELDILPPVRDPNLLNGKLLGALGDLRCATSASAPRKVQFRTW